MSKKKKKNKSTGGGEVQLEAVQKKQDLLKEEVRQFEEEKQVFYDELTQREEKIVESMARLEEAEADINGYLAKRQKEGEEKLAQELEALFGTERARLEAEQEDLRQKLAEDWSKRGAEIDRLVAKRMEQADAMIQSQMDQLAEKQQGFRDKMEEMQEEKRVLLQQRHHIELEQQERDSKANLELERKELVFAQEKEQFMLERGQLQGSNTRLKGQLSSQEAHYESQLLDMQKQLQDMEEKYETQWNRRQAEEHKLREYQQAFGGDLQSYQNKMEELERQNQELKEALAHSVPKSVVVELEESRKLYHEIYAQKSQWESAVGKARSLELAQEELSHALSLAQGRIQFREEENQMLRVNAQNLEGELSEMKLRYCTSSVLSEDAVRRVAQITEDFDLGCLSEAYSDKTTEIQWLGGILDRCKQVQMEFPLRIFMAFHTALKISDWSIVTVLAGVSGTGKSKLPELYSAYGGIHFMSVPVQENWDSPESMLGYFNTMDNRFEPQPLLKFLISAMELPPEGRSMVEHCMGTEQNEDKRLHLEEGERTLSLVLLDEMNLAHVEQYFSDFLSKLENRRGNRDVPSIPLRLGTGIPTYPLKLWRNVLWAGTMNQDETTKSLSDKVLDRGVMISFPRPDSFERRESQRVQGKGEKRLPCKVWKKWQTNHVTYSVKVENVGQVVNEEAKYEMIGATPEVSGGDWVNYKAVVEEINHMLGREGLALGHRVWQAMEYYVVNYPFVILEMERSYDPERECCVLTPNLKFALQIAMEDVIVQKIMPKLRGVEYVDGGMLEDLGALLGNYFPRLREDYQRACRQGYGQFMWVTSHYALGTNSLDRWAEDVWGQEPV